MLILLIAAINLMMVLKFKVYTHIHMFTHEYA